MPSLTGNPVVDWLIIAAAALTAISVIWYKGIVPLSKIIRRVRDFFNKVESAFDLAADLPPDKRDALFATQARLIAGHSEIVSLLETTNERIDSHMNAEESSLEKVAESIEGIEASLAGHMAADAKQFIDVGNALVEGQARLDDKLAAILKGSA